MFQYAIFDMDGTIADSMYVWRNVTNQILASYGIPLTEELDALLHQKTNEEAAVYLHEQFLPEIAPEKILDDIDRIVLVEYQQRIPLKPGVLETLTRLKELNIPAALVTASSRIYVDALFSRLHLEDFFQFILSCPEFGKGKNSPDIYLYAAEKLGGTVAQTAVFEDAFHAVQTAASAGFPVYAVAEPVMAKNREKIEALAYRFLERMDEVLDELPLPSAVR